jgi:propionyl-CoA carboxylase alpha chain
MPGTVVKIADGVITGSSVQAGEPIVWLEAMKMQHRIAAPVTGTVTALPVSAGQQVELGTLLAVVESIQP